MATVKVIGKGQIVIVAAMRKKYKIRRGAEIQIFEYGNLICLVPPSEDPVKSATGCLPGEPSFTEER